MGALAKKGQWGKQKIRRCCLQMYLSPWLVLDVLIRLVSCHNPKRCSAVDKHQSNKLLSQCRALDPPKVPPKKALLPLFLSLEARSHWRWGRQQEAIPQCCLPPWNNASGWEAARLRGALAERSHHSPQTQLQPQPKASAPEAPGQPPSGSSPATKPEQWRRLRFGERPQPIMGEPDLLASEGPCSRSWGFGIGTASMEVLAQEGALMYQELLAKQLQKWPLAFDVPL